jgi:hypothetical protein
LSTRHAVILWQLEKRKLSYERKASLGTACVPKAKLASAARLMRVIYFCTPMIAQLAL